MTDQIEITKRDDGRIQLRTPFHMANVCRALPGRRWDPTNKVWHVPGTPATAVALLNKLDCLTSINEIPPWLMDLARLGGQADDIRACDPTTLPDIPLTKFPPWSNQLRGYHMILRQQASYLAWDMGTGKSKSIVDAVTNIPDLTCAMILCPSSVVHVWPKEFRKHSGAPDDILVTSLTKGTVAKRTAQAAAAVAHAQRVGKRAVIVINFEAAWRPDFAKWSLGIQWGLVVADEAHRVKAPGGKASKYLHQLGRKAERRVCLSGTPMPHSPLDVYAQFRFLDAGIYGTSFAAFRAKHAIMGGYENHQILRYQNLDDLHNKFYSIADRVVKADVLDLPDFVHEDRIIEMSPKSRRIYKELEDEMIADVGAGVVTANNALSRLLRLQQITSGYTVVESPDLVDHRGDARQDVIELSDEKQKALTDLFKNDLAPGQPVVVFCRFHHDLDAIHAAAEAAGRESLELSGRRKEILGYWEDGPDTVAAVQIHSGGVGIDLTRSSVVVYYSIGFDGGDYEQSLARCHRQGQTNKVTYIHFIMEGTIDRKIQTAIERKAQIVQSVLEQMIEK